MVKLSAQTPAVSLLVGGLGTIADASSLVQTSSSSESVTLVPIARITTDANNNGILKALQATDGTYPNDIAAVFGPYINTGQVTPSQIVATAQKSGMPCVEMFVLPTISS